MSAISIFLKQENDETEYDQESEQESEDQSELVPENLENSDFPELNNRIQIDENLVLEGLPDQPGGLKIPQAGCFEMLLLAVFRSGNLFPILKFGPRDPKI